VINGCLKNGAAGIQLSMLRTRAQADACVTRCVPAGGTSLGQPRQSRRQRRRDGLAGYLGRDAAEPAVLVGQIETAANRPLEQILAGSTSASSATTTWPSIWAWRRGF